MHILWIGILEYSINIYSISCKLKCQVACPFTRDRENPDSSGTPNPRPLWYTSSALPTGSRYTVPESHISLWDSCLIQPQMLSCHLVKRQHWCSCRTSARSRLRVCSWTCSTRTRRRPSHTRWFYCHPDSRLLAAPEAPLCESVVIQWTVNNCQKSWVSTEQWAISCTLLRQICYLAIVTLQVANILKGCWWVQLNHVSMNSSKHMASIAEWTLKSIEYKGFYEHHWAKYQLYSCYRIPIRLSLIAWTVVILEIWYSIQQNAC